MSTFNVFMIAYQIFCRKLQKTVGVRQLCIILEYHKEIQNWIANWVKTNSLQVY